MVDRKKGGRSKPWPVKIKRAFNKSLIKAVNRIDFIRIMEKIAQSERGAYWYSQFKDQEPHWNDQEEVAELAVDLTLAQLRREGFKSKRDDIKALVDSIKVAYDHHIHIYGEAGVSIILSTLFSHQDHTRPFISPDGREIAHVQKIKDYQDKGLGVLYLVNHSSHLDEFLVDCMVGYAGLKLPIFAAGANMMAIGSLAKLLRAGSYVVQRKGASRPGLASLFNYCRAISDSGHQQGIFLEAWHGGARSRDGGLRYPRRLVTLRGALAGENDVVIQPVALSYSIVPEDLSLAARLGPRCWIRGAGAARTLGLALLHPRSFIGRTFEDIYGRAYLDMPEPVLLSELKKAHAEARSDLDLDEYVGLTAIREIARHKKILSSQLTARGLWRLGRLGEKDLISATERELERLTEYHRNTFGQGPNLEDFIRHHSITDVVRDGLATLRKRAVIGPFSKRLFAAPRPDKIAPPPVLSRRGLAFYATHGDRRIYSPTADKNLVVVGGGDWGFALTHLIGRRILEEKSYLNASLTLFDSNPETAREMNEMRTPKGRYEEILLPRNAFVTSDPPSAFRQASEVILASPPEEMAEQIKTILNRSEQALRLVVASCGFEPTTHRLPCQVALDLAAEAGRSDIEVYALVGPVSEDDLVELKPATGVIAGPEKGLKVVANLFDWPPVGVETSTDPLGVQAASGLARIYSLWGNVLTRSGQMKGAATLGRYMAHSAGEATQLGLALGGRAETFSASSLAWTATFLAEGLSGPAYRFAHKLGGAVKKNESPIKAAAKLHRQMEAAGYGIPAYRDLKSALFLARKHNLDLPILFQAGETIWGE